MVVVRVTGISDQFKVTDSGAAEVSVGRCQNINCNIDESCELAGGIGMGRAYQYHKDGVVYKSGSLEIDAIDLKVLQLLGTYTAGWTVAAANALPVYTIAMNTTATQLLTMTGAKFGKATIDFKEGGAIKISFDYKALTHAYTTATVTYTQPSASALMFTSAKVKWGASYLGVVNTGSITIDRETEAKRGIENQADRNPSQIVEGMEKIDFTLNVDVTDDTGWSLMDTRTAATMLLETTATAGTLTVTGCVIHDIKFDKSADGKVRTVVMHGTGLGWSVAGS